MPTSNRETWRAQAIMRIVFKVTGGLTSFRTFGRQLVLIWILLAGSTCGVGTTISRIPSL
jgi:hypothetical protein